MPANILNLAAYNITGIQVHGLLWAVRHEAARNSRAGCCPKRAFALAMASCTGRYFASSA